jgi:hypothetical protein
VIGSKLPFTFTRPLSREWTLRLRGMLSETATSTRAWIFKRKKDWSVYMGSASQAVPKLVIFGKEDAMNSIVFVDYIKVSLFFILLS